MDNYYQIQYNIYQNTNEIIENQETTTQQLIELNSNITTITSFIIVIAIILCANVIHHIVDAGWKKY